MPCLLKGWLNDGELPLQATPYYSLRDELAVQDGLILKGERVVISATLRKQMKNKVHSSHMGIESCLRRSRARSTSSGARFSKNPITYRVRKARFSIICISKRKKSIGIKLCMEVDFVCIKVVRKRTALIT